MESLKVLQHSIKFDVHKNYGSGDKMVLVRTGLVYFCPCCNNPKKSCQTPKKVTLKALIVLSEGKFNTQLQGTFLSLVILFGA